jgi:transcriptional regulator with XRE-family HTH domain
MSLKQWEKKVLEAPGAEERVRQIEEELRLTAGLTALREKAHVSQRELARRIGVSQPRIAAIERSRNVTIDVLEQYVAALGAQLEVTVVQGGRRTRLLGTHQQAASGSRAGTMNAPQVPAAATLGKSSARKTGTKRRSA